MKYFFLVLALLPLYAIAQVTEYENEKFLEFSLQFPQDSTSATGIDWRKEKLISDFTLNGTSPLQYSITLKNDTIAALSKFENGKWQFQENIYYTDWAVRQVDDSRVISEFKITDFDNDGNEDLTCWTHTNVNGNMWTIILLNDQKSKKLVKLYNTANETDIWDRPEYDPTTGIISCTLDGSAFGASEESTYKLNDFHVQPLKKHRQERYYKRYIKELYYTGKNGKWKLIKSSKTKG